MPKRPVSPSFVVWASVSPAQVAHAGTHLHLAVVDVHAPADAVHALDGHGPGHAAGPRHHQVSLGGGGQAGANEPPVHHHLPAGAGAAEAGGGGHLALHGAHGHLVAIGHPVDGALGGAFEGLLVGQLHVAAAHAHAGTASAGQGAAEGAAHGRLVGHGAALPHLAAVAVDGALGVLAAVGGFPLGHHAAGVAAVHHPGLDLARVLPHARVHGHGVVIYGAAGPHVPLEAAHSCVCVVHRAGVTAAATFSNTANADTMVLGHGWAGRLGAEGRPLGHTWTLNNKEKRKVSSREFNN